MCHTVFTFFIDYIWLRPWLTLHIYVFDFKRSSLSKTMRELHDTIEYAGKSNLAIWATFFWWCLCVCGVCVRVCVCVCVCVCVSVGCMHTVSLASVLCGERQGRVTARKVAQDLRTPCSPEWR